MTSPTTSGSASNVVQSTSLSINALLGPTKWGGATGSGAVLTYSFPWTSSATASFAGYNGGTYSSLNEPTASLHFGLNTSQQEAAQSALQSWANVANITLSETKETTSSVGDIRFGFTSADYGGAWGWASYPDKYAPAAGDIWISATIGTNDQSSESWAKGTFNYEALLHETGHALGLKHPFEGTTVLPVSLDDEHNTVMSYTSPPNNLYYSFDGQYWSGHYVSPETPMVLDIAAIQHIYGANTSYHPGNDTYTFDPATPFYRTIWDAAGNDTLSAANFTLPCRIDLTPGSYSSLKFAVPNVTGATYDGTENLGIAYGCRIENALGGSSDDAITGNSADNFIDGGSGNDTAVLSSALLYYTVTKTGNTYTVRANMGADNSTDTLINIERLQFADKTVNLTIQALAAATPQADVQHIEELYVAFFNRVPDADGLSYWINQMNAGQTINQIADAFYDAGVQYSSVTGFSVGMSNADFVNVVYRNTLGRREGADADGLTYWTEKLASGEATHGTLVAKILSDAHAFKGDPTWGWVPDLLDNKLAVANTFAVTLGLNYNTPGASISHGMAIAAAVTPTSTTEAIALIGVSGTDLHLV